MDEDKRVSDFRSKAWAIKEALDDDEEDNGNSGSGNCQWLAIGRDLFTPSARTVRSLSPGIYDVFMRDGNIFFKATPPEQEEIIEFPNTASSKVLDEIRSFWNSREKYRKHRLPYRRGILLHGPPGCGKTCIIKIIAAEVMRLGGIVILSQNIDAISTAISQLAVIQPKTHIVVVLEDLDAILQHEDESKVCNLLDGIGKPMDRIVFVTTTNYLNKLPARLVCRPTRFDRRFCIDMPSVDTRIRYLQNLVNKDGEAKALTKKTISRMAKDTANLSLAFTKDLFVSITCLGNSYEDALKALRDHAKKPKEKSNSDD